ncbi:hypothetical protein JK165_08700 [Acetobacter okinawensis]|uniref:hypothetical protein n=1 Tax=Acetobacter okinawensis TaxID=1076594 RepID=UPI001BA77FF7|nr:hypothetical protein [Acetobacter okinawensis]MBS0966163.1 hypothetical protein [Acetobacter okinawensis]
MTQTKLEIIGPYTPEHEGPFCTRDGVVVEIMTKKDRNGKVLGYVGDRKDLTEWETAGQFDPTRMSDTEYDLMNAREVPVAREFWVNEFKGGLFSEAHTSADDAMGASIGMGAFIRTIHVREVLPGEGA